MAQGGAVSQHTHGRVARGWVAPILVTGLGLGGFVDGIVLHEILQWHHMVSATEGAPLTSLEGLKRNTTGDGLFHALAWALVLGGLLGLLAAWRRGRPAPSWRSVAGLLLAGWGIFNVVEGVVDHHVLGVHHVRDDLDGPLAWDLGFLAVGAVLVVVGLALHVSTSRGGAHAD